MGGFEPNAPQNPLSRPTEKQELSWLKLTERACERFVVAICGRVFISGKEEENVKEEGAREGV